jgi:hypothetical protein
MDPGVNVMIKIFRDFGHFLQKKINHGFKRSDISRRDFSCWLRVAALRDTSGIMTVLNSGI